MAKSWFGWFGGKTEVERRVERPQAAIAVGPDDIDPLTGTLRWDRFQVMLEAEQTQEPGVLLLIDLSERSIRVGGSDEAKALEILPWLAQAIRQAIRADDLLAHVDGYRFAVLLRGAPQEVGQITSDRILDSVDNTIFMTADGISKLDVTIGGQTFEVADGQTLFDLAAANLERAKRLDQPALVE